MKFSLPNSAVDKAVRDYLSDPGEEAEIAIRLAEGVPLKVSYGRGGYTVYTGDDALDFEKRSAERRQKKEEAE